MVFEERAEYLRKIISLRKTINDGVEEKQYNELLMNQGISDLGLQLNKNVIEEQKDLKQILYTQNDNIKEIEGQQNNIITAANNISKLIKKK